MYIILNGRVRIFRREGDTEHEIALLGPGAYFGELALLDGAPRTANAVAVENSCLVGFFRPEFLEILETHGRIGAKISLALARITGTRLRKTLTGNPDCTSL
jgi:CRP/FNR family cyclic AMP-dependent transcriptional regulator